MGKDRANRVLKWPERHGFSIGGYGPYCYILKIVHGSPADKQGLKLGDQIIEINGHNTHRMAAPALEKFTKLLDLSKISVKVTNKVQCIELIAHRLHGFGLSLQYSQRHGCLVEDVNPRGPANGAGLRSGDLPPHPLVQYIICLFLKIHLMSQTSMNCIKICLYY